MGDGSWPPVVPARILRAVRKLPYYASSAVVLARIATVRSIVARAAHPAGPLVLRDGPRLQVATRRDLLVVKECLVDDVYGLRRIPAETSGMVVDVGAGVGEFALAAADRLPRATILAFEPAPSTFRLLQENVESAGATIHIAPYAIGVGGQEVLWRTDAGPLATAVPTAGGEGVTVSGCRLDEVVPDGQVALLKIDCEGLELDVLEGGAATLGRTRRVVLEYHLHLVRDGAARAVAILRAAGFETASRPDPYDPRIGYVHAWRLSGSTRASEDDTTRRGTLPR